MPFRSILHSVGASVVYGGTKSDIEYGAAEKFITCKTGLQNPRALAQYSYVLSV